MIGGYGSNNSKTMENKIKEMISKRQSANLEILNKIGEMVLNYPNLRFGQILVNLNIIEYQRDPASFDIIGVKDPFNEESVITLNRIKK